MKKIGLAVWNFITGFLGKVAKELEDPAKIAIQVVNVIKDYVFNPVVDILTALSRTGLDNKIVELIRQYLPGVLAKMMIGEGIIKSVSSGDLSSLLRIFSEYIQNVTAENRGKWWADLTAIILPLIAGKEVPKPLAMSVSQAIYLKNVA